MHGTKQWRRRLASGVVAATATTAVLAGATPALATPSALVNGGFETGNLTGWTADTSSGGSDTVVTTYTGSTQGAPSTYAPTEGSRFALLNPGKPGVYTLLSQPFTAAAGDTISGDAFFKANDYQPFNDNGGVVVLDASGAVIGNPFTASVPSVGDYKGTPWTHWSYAVPTSGTFRIQARVENISDSANSSVVGLDNVATSAPKPAAPISWASPSPITYGTPLSSAQLNATTTAAGTMTYSPPIGTVLPAGTQNLTATFTSADPAFASSSSTVPLTVNRGAPIVTWSPPAPMTYPAALTAAQLNATANMPGTFAYADAVTGAPVGVGTVLPAGTSTLTVTFTPTNSANYAPVAKTVPVVVAKGAQSIVFAPLAPRSYGAAPFTVSATGGKSSSPVTLTAGSGDTCSLSDAGSGTDASGFGTVHATVSLTGAGSCTLTAAQAGDGNYAAAPSNPQSFSIAKVTPTLTWAAPAPVSYGTPLGADQLNAKASVPGTFSYDVPAGTVLHAGTSTVVATFTPTDTANYTTEVVSAAVTVTQATQQLDFAALPDRTYGDAPFTLAATGGASGTAVTYAVTGPCQLSQTEAGATVTLLAAGACSVTASQAGTDDYLSAADVTRSFTVAKATPQISWDAPAELTYGAPLTATQLAAAGNVAGSFAYTADESAADANGQILHAGTHTLHAAFVPADSADYTSASASVPLYIEKALPTLTWSPDQGSLVFGQPLGDGQLDATSDVAGAFVYSSSVGDVLHAGTHSLSATFTPTDSEDFLAGTVGAQVVVDRAPQTVGFESVADHTFGDPAFTVSATGGPSGLPVAFAATDSCTLSAPSSSVGPDGSGSGTASVLLTGAGGCTLTASQDGNADYLPATDVVRSFSVAKATPQLAWTTPAAVGYGTALGAGQLTATSSVPGSFSYAIDGGNSDATGVVPHAGTHTLSVTFTPADGANYTAATSSVSLTVDKASQSIGFGSLGDKTFGDGPIRVVATGGNSGAPVTFTAAPGGACSVGTGGTVALTGAGLCSLTATQDGNADYQPAPPVTRSFTVAKKQSALVLAPIAARTYGDAPVQLSVTGSGSSSAVTLVAGPQSVCVLSGNLVTITGPGSCTVTAGQTGDANYRASPSVTRSFSVAYAVGSLNDKLTVHQGATLPIKLTLLSSTGRNMSNSTVTVHATGVDASTFAPSPGNSQPGQNFTFASGPPSYQYNVKTTDLALGVHTLAFTAGTDPTVHTVTFTVT